MALQWCMCVDSPNLIRLPDPTWVCVCALYKYKNFIYLAVTHKFFQEYIISSSSQQCKLDTVDVKYSYILLMWTVHLLMCVIKHSLVIVEFQQCNCIHVLDGN